VAGYVVYLNEIIIAFKISPSFLNSLVTDFSFTFLVVFTCQGAEYYNTHIRAVGICTSITLFMAIALRL
jgi:hypothetical protein